MNVKFILHILSDLNFSYKLGFLLGKRFGQILDGLAEAHIEDGFIAGHRHDG